MGSTKHQPANKVAGINRKVEAVVTRLTPAAAQQLLRNNDHNRPLNSSRIAKLTKAIAEGRWKLNGESIKIDTKNRLLDGQHRLHAIIHADKPIDTVLVTGLSPNAFDTIDQGRPRGGADIFHICGVRNPSMVSASLTIVYQSRHGHTEGSHDGRYIPDADERVSLFDELKGYEEIVAEVSSKSKHLRGLPTAMLAGFHFLFVEKSRPAATAFLVQLANYQTTAENNPARALRAKFFWLAEQDYTISRQAQAALIKKAWNAFVSGQSVRELEIPNTLQIEIEPVTSERWLSIEEQTKS